MHTSKVFPEAQAFAREALAEAELPVRPDHPAATRLSSLAQSIIQQSTGLLDVLEGGDLPDVEARYSEMSCAVSELRHLRSVGVTARGEGEAAAVADEHLRQLLPMELVLLSLQFSFVDWTKCHQQFTVFPRLSRGARRLSVTSPESLGVLQLGTFSHHVSRLFTPKPLFVGCIEVISVWVLWVKLISLGLDFSPFITCA